jgi:CDP-diacylglycerol--glycerol-3-phosphate 3-phosphatidyltransferase
MFTEWLERKVREFAKNAVVKTGLTHFSPNTITMFGLLITAIAALVVASGNLVAGGVILLFSSVFDILDGAVARATNRVHPYGAFLDSTTDRFSEGFVYMGLLWYFLSTGSHPLECMLIIAAFNGSLIVSYARARAQSLNFKCDGGMFARPERVVFTVAGLLIQPLLLPVLWILAVFTNLTAVQRIWIVWRQARAQLKSPAV